MSASLGFSQPQSKRFLSTHEKGQRSEDLVAEHLRSKNWQIIGRNIFTKFGEIDILAKENDEFVCVEVRSRTRHTSIPPELSVSWRKYQHLVRSLLSLPRLYNRPTRIDLITVEAGAITNHYRDFSPHPRGHYA